MDEKNISGSTPAEQPAARQPEKRPTPVHSAKTPADPAKQPEKRPTPVHSAKTPAEPARQPEKRPTPVPSAKTPAEPAKQPEKRPTPVPSAKTPAEPAKQPESAVQAGEEETVRLIEELRALGGEERPEFPQTPAAAAAEFRDEEYRETFGEGEELERVFSEEPYQAPDMQSPEAAPAGPQEPVPPEQPPEKMPPHRRKSKEMPIRKGRPKRKKGYGLLGIPHILATVIWLVIVVAIGVSLGRVIWVCASDVLAFGREEKEVVLTVEESDTLDDIAVKLKDAGLIRYPDLFKFYGTFTDAREDISSGTFTLNTIYDYHALVGQMSYYSTNREIVSVTIPEGYSCEQMFRLLEEKGVSTVEKLENYAATGELDDYWFLEGVERGDKYCLEGFLFPDTYDFYVNDDAEHVLEKLLDTFDKRFNEDMVAGIDALNAKLSDMMYANGYDETYVSEHQMDVRKIITVASLIEKETAGKDESFTISSVIYNRLTNPAEYPYLNIDAALLYALGHKEALTAEDLQTDTPYNTYLYAGLVPGPITNPGLNSINAALMPSDTNYHFYVLDTNSDEREHHFSETLAEHEAFIESLGG